MEEMTVGREEEVVEVTIADSEQIRNDTISRFAPRISQIPKSIRKRLTATPNVRIKHRRLHSIRPHALWLRISLSQIIQ